MLFYQILDGGFKDIHIKMIMYDDLVVISTYTTDSFVYTGLYGHEYANLFVDYYVAGADEQLIKRI